MIGLFDRDVFLKLCCCNLWAECIVSLGITHPYRLASTSSERSNRKAVSKMLPNVDNDEAVQRTLQLSAAVPVLSDELLDGILTSERYQALGQIDDIDAGEQVLAAILLTNPDGRILVTGDKRFVKAFRSQLPDEWDLHKGSIISFESCLIAIEQFYGFEYVLARVINARTCDQSLRIAVGHNPDRGSFLAALNSYDPRNEGA